MKDKCIWILDKNADSYENNCYDTSCKNRFSLLVGSLGENYFHYCPDCGKEIEEKL